LISDQNFLTHSVLLSLPSMASLYLNQRTMMLTMKLCSSG